VPRSAWLGRAHPGHLRPHQAILEPDIQHRVAPRWVSFPSRPGSSRANARSREFDLSYHPLLPRDPSPATSQHELLHLTRRGFRKLVDEANPLRCLEVGQTIPHVKLEFVRGHFGSVAQDHKGMGRFASPLMRNANDRHFLNGRVTQQAALDLDRGDVLATADDDILEAISDFHIPIRMNHRGVA
jgi:hypothetical protein